MTVLRGLMADDHRRCDELFAQAEQAAANGDWAATASAFAGFEQALERHFGAEESDLFPAFEVATGITMGPTRMMRYEHQEMRALAVEIGEAIERRDDEAYRGLAETLLIMMQQHNLKEENILYPMCDESLAPQSAQLASQLQALITHS